MTTHDPEFDWIEKAADGDEEAVRCLVDRYERPLMRFLSRHVASPEVIEELAQLTFVRAVRQLPLLKDRTRFRGWLWAIARCAAMDHVRKKARRAANAPELIEGCVFDELPGSTVEPSRDIERESVLERTRNVIQGLEAEARELLDLRYGKDLTYEEIGELTGLGAVTVKARIARLRQRLRPVLSGLALEWMTLDDEMS